MEFDPPGAPNPAPAGSLAERDPAVGHLVVPPPVSRVSTVVPPRIGDHEDGAAGEPADGGAGRRHLKLAAGVVVGLIMVAAVILRFWTRSDMWLDEALTVNISGQPVRAIPSLLRRDGAPPLFYVLLHFWMGLFGRSDLAVRSLSGVFGVVTIPVAGLAGRRLGGRTVARAAMLLVATSPFAVYYDTEARMYALVALLTALGYLAFDRALRQPRPGNLIAVASVTTLLLYSQYWSFYLIATVFVWLAWHAWKSETPLRRSARAAMAAMIAGGAAFLPWVPTFFYQSRHTGTPWAVPADFAAMINAVSSFAGGATSQGRALAIVYFSLAGLGLFGAAVSRRHIDLDLRTRPLGRPLAWTVVGTLFLAIIGGFISHSAFSPRYASVVFVPLVLLVALGLTTFADRRVRLAILGVALVAGLAGSVPNVTTNRTQAAQVTAAIDARGHVGDVVAYCPDQLGPPVERLLAKGRYQQITFPRGTGPTYVNWVDYAAASAAASPARFAARTAAMAGPGHRIFMVWAPGYQTFGRKCEAIIQTLQASPGWTTAEIVGGDPTRYYEPMWLYQFTSSAP